MKKYKTVREQLLNRRDVLSERLNRVTTDLRKIKNADSTERATERGNDEVLLALSASMRDEIRQIESSLKRIENNQYDICALCGKKISEKRLQALPYTDYCVTCVEKQE